jgi:teichuronic acid biosynthesis glycosyltransferase TuaG
MTIRKPIVSVITPVFNASKFIPRLLECVENQELNMCEHILVDDCSQDNSYALLCEAALKNSCIKVIRLSKNSGPVVARNEAIKYASGKYLAFLDADDYWMPNKLATQVNFMEENDAALSFSDYRFISEDGRLIGDRISGFSKIGWALHHMTRYLGCLTIIVNLEKVPDFQFPNIRPAIRAEDFLAWSNVIQKTGPALRCPHDLARYAQVANSRSSLGIRAAKSVWELYRCLEKISLVKAIPYFIAYVFFTCFKRSWYRPRLESSMIDGEFAKKYLLDARND